MIRVDVTEYVSADLESLGAAELIIFDAAIESLAKATHVEWQNLAQTRLKSSRSEYIRGINTTQRGEREWEISLNGWLPNAVEGGLNPFDMKPGLLGGKKAKIAKDGSKYTTIPFRHFRNSKSAERISKVPNYKTDLAKVLRATGLGKKTMVGTGKVGVAKNTASLVAKLKPHHKTNIFEGLTKYQKMYGKKVGNQYMTFRRVSDKSDPVAWLHPGIRAANLLADVEMFARSEAEVIFGDLF